MFRLLLDPLVLLYHIWLRVLSGWGPVWGSAHVGDHSDTVSPREDRVQATSGPMNDRIKWFPVLCWSLQTARFWNEDDDDDGAHQQRYTATIETAYLDQSHLQVDHCPQLRGTTPLDPPSSIWTFRTSRTSRTSVDLSWIHILCSAGEPQSSWTQRTNICFLCL